MTERVSIAVGKIINMWNSVSESIIDALELGDINRTEAKEALIELQTELLPAKAGRFGELKR